MYGRWKNETYLKHSILIYNRTLLLKKAKYIMMRITKETIKPVSRSIGKHSHNFPGPIFEYVSLPTFVRLLPILIKYTAYLMY